MARLRDSGRTRLAAPQQPRNPQPESIARSPYHTAPRPPARHGVRLSRRSACDQAQGLGASLSDLRQAPAGEPGGGGREQAAGAGPGLHRGAAEGTRHGAEQEGAASARSGAEPVQGGLSWRTRSSAAEHPRPAQPRCFEQVLKRRKGRNALLNAEVTSLTGSTSDLLSGNDRGCRRKAKMSALSKVKLSVSYPLGSRDGGGRSDERGADEQPRTQPDRCSGPPWERPSHPRGRRRAA